MRLRYIPENSSRQSCAEQAAFFLNPAVLTLKNDKNHLLKFIISKLFLSLFLIAQKSENFYLEKVVPKLKKSCKSWQNFAYDNRHSSSVRVGLASWDCDKAKIFKVIAECCYKNFIYALWQKCYEIFQLKRCHWNVACHKVVKILRYSFLLTHHT